MKAAIIWDKSLQIVQFQGNRLFKEGKFELAKAKYEKACILHHVDLFHLIIL